MLQEELAQSAADALRMPDGVDEAEVPSALRWRPDRLDRVEIELLPSSRPSA